MKFKVGCGTRSVIYDVIMRVYDDGNWSEDMSNDLLSNVVFCLEYDKDSEAFKVSDEEFDLIITYIDNWRDNEGDFYDSVCKENNWKNTENHFRESYIILVKGV